MFIITDYRLKPNFILCMAIARPKGSIILSCMGGPNDKFIPDNTQITVRVASKMGNVFVQISMRIKRANTLPAAFGGQQKVPCQLYGSIDGMTGMHGKKKSWMDLHCFRWEHLSNSREC